MSSVVTLVIIVTSFITGVLLSLGYMIWRMMRNKGWDDSNMTNALRLISHTVLHANDFGKMYYLDADIVEKLKKEGVDLKRPFWYIDKDELSEVVKTRP